MNKLALVILIVILSVGCKKQKETLLQGRWDMYEIPEQPWDEIWSFAPNNTVHKIQITNAEVDTIASGSYILKNNTITIAGPNTTTSDLFGGDYTIKRLDKNYLVLHRHQNGLIYYEFAKQN